MSRLVNTLARVISLSKELERQVQSGNLSVARKLFILLQKTDRELLQNLGRESGSYLLQQKVLEIHDLILALSPSDLENSSRLLSLLHRIIALEHFQISVIPAKEGLSLEIQKIIDPYIQKLVIDINTLSFVLRTNSSCSGHPHFQSEMFGDMNINGGISILYDTLSPTKHVIPLFHQELAQVCSKAELWTIENGYPPSMYKDVDPQTAETMRRSAVQKGVISIQEEISVKDIFRYSVVLGSYHLHPTSYLEEKFARDNKVPMVSRDGHLVAVDKDYWRPRWETFLAGIDVKKFCQEYLIQHWNLFLKVVQKYKDRDTLTFSDEKTSLSRDTSLLEKQGK